MNEFVEQIETLQNALIAQATGGSADDREYQRLRVLIVENPSVRDIVPKFLRTCRNLSQFGNSSSMSSAAMRNDVNTYGMRSVPF